MHIAGVQVFPELAAWQLVFLAAVYFMASFVKGTFGFGAMAPLIIFGAWVLGPHDAVLIAVMANAVTQAQLFREARNDADWRTVRTVLPGFAVSFLVGLWIFGRLGPGALTILLGLGLGGMIAADFAGLLQGLVARFGSGNRAFGVVLSLVAGTMAGVTGAGGIILMSLYFKVAIHDARALRATALVMATAVLIWRLGAIVAAGFVTMPLLIESVFVLPFGILGTWIGARYFRTLDARAYFKVFRIALMVGAAILIGKGLAAVL